MLVLRSLVGVAAQLALFAAGLFLPAGTWDWPRATQFLVVYAIVVSAAVREAIRIVMPDAGGTRTSRLKEAVDPFSQDVRGKGCLIGIELDQPAKPVVGRLRELGVLAGGTVHPNVIRIMPPLNTSDEEVDEFAAALKTAVG